MSSTADAGTTVLAAMPIAIAATPIGANSFFIRTLFPSCEGAIHNSDFFQPPARHRRAGSPRLCIPLRRPGVSRKKPHSRRPYSTRDAYSHSMVPGGLLVTSSTTRFTSGTSLVIRVEMRSNVSYGTRVQSAVIASSLDTGRSTIGCP